MSKVGQVSSLESNVELLASAEAAQKQLQRQMAKTLHSLSYNEVAALDHEAAKLKKRIAALRGAITRSKRSRA